MTQPRPSPEPHPARETRSLALMFGVMYFVQGIAEPTEGLITQPVRSLLKSWGHSAGDIAAFAAALSIPWMIKPVYGLVTDFLPIAGSRRRSWLLLSTSTTAAALAALYLAPPAAGEAAWLLAMLLVPAAGVAFSDVVVDALMVEKGQPRGITGQLQSVQWSAIYLAMIATGVSGGWLAAQGRQELGFLVCALFAAGSFALVLGVVREAPASGAPRGRAALAHGFAAMGTRPVIVAAAFLFLLNFNPFSSAVLYVHATRSLGIGEQFYGVTVSILATASLAASVSYGFYCRRVAFGRLIHAGIALAVVSTLAYAFVSGEASLVAVTVAVGVSYMTATLIQLDVAARSCPPEVAGTVFALLMSVANFGTASGAAIGGQLYDAGLDAFGATAAFRTLVVAGASCTALCWLLVPQLRRTLSSLAP